MHICYILGAGAQYDPPPPGPGDFVIAVDGGFAYAGQQGIRPDLVIGDFDSLREPVPPDIETVALPQEKDDTDMVAALRAGWERGFRRFHIHGGTGGRIDHTLANIQCLADIARRGGRGFLFDRDTVITAIHDGGIAFPAEACGIVSVFAFSEAATGVYERGLKYPLTDATVRNTHPIGVSNEFTGAPASITVQSGTLVVLYPRGVREIDL